MSVWFFIVVATGLGGALALWHGVGRTKHCSEEMLVKYIKMLAEAREEKLKELTLSDEDEDEDGEEQTEDDSEGGPRAQSDGA